MTTQAILMYENGRIEVPEDVRAELDLKDGARVRLIPESTVTPLEPSALPEWEWKPNSDWKRLEGILAGRGMMSAAELHETEALIEQAAEERNLGHGFGNQSPARS